METLAEAAGVLSMPAGATLTDIASKTQCVGFVVEGAGGAESAGTAETTGSKESAESADLSRGIRGP